MDRNYYYTFASAKRQNTKNTRNKDKTIVRVVLVHVALSLLALRNLSVLCGSAMNH